MTIALPNLPEVVYAVLACNYIGAIANMIHPLAGADEIDRYLTEAESKIFIAFSGTYETTRGKLSSTFLRKTVVVSPLQSVSKIISLKDYNGLKENEKEIRWCQFVNLGKNTQSKKKE